MKIKNGKITVKIIRNSNIKSIRVDGHSDNQKILSNPIVGSSIGIEVLVDENVSLSGDTWYRCEFVPNNDGTEDWFMYNTQGTQIASATTSDGTYSSGGFGFRMGYGSDSAFYDDVRRWE